jgi:Carboxyl transferase domain
MEAGQVWCRNSAYKTVKTVQAIFDFQREGLLLIIANWCGPSGGRQDMLTRYCDIHIAFDLLIDCSLQIAVRRSACSR